MIFGWSVIDTPNGPGEPVKGLVTAFQLTGHGESVALVQPPGGPILRVKGVTAPIGGQVNCTRYLNKYWPNESYECQHPH